MHLLSILKGTPGETQPPRVWSGDSPAVLTVVISVLVPVIAGLLALIAAATVCIYRQRRQKYTPRTYEQPAMSSKGPSRIVGPMEYEVAVIAPYATCSAADIHQYDEVKAPESGVYEKMQSVTLLSVVGTSPYNFSAHTPQYASTTRTAELQTVVFISV